MGNVNCSSAFCGKDEKYKEKQKFKSLLAKAESSSIIIIKSSTADESKPISFDVVPGGYGIGRGARDSAKIMNLESPVGGETEQAYDGEDEHDDNDEETASLKKREKCDWDLQAHHHVYGLSGADKSESSYEKRTDRDAENYEAAADIAATSGHISDPGGHGHHGKAAEFMASPTLKRSCSDLMIQAPPRLRTWPSREASQRFAPEEHQGSPLSTMSHGSADKVMLKKHSSSQILPSRSRKLWWKLFLWSHRNLQKKLPRVEASKSMEFSKLKDSLGQLKEGGYCSDTIEANHLCSPSESSLFTGKPPKNETSSGFWPQNQWVALPAESSTFSRIDQWIQELPLQPLQQADSEYSEDIFAFQPSVDAGTSSAQGGHIPEELLHAKSVVQSLNSSSAVAHIARTGLNVVPPISCFSGLRQVNLSGNFIVHISPGSLPKGLHVLNLSRNKIHTIAGLRELTRLHSLDLSYNQISRIGQGVSSCTHIKELYLAGNKISEVEGLHRLLKLTMLDLSFNKITMTKALSQLIANYNSLLALNLVGNPIQNNMGDDQLRKTVRSLLPKLAFLNKQPTDPQVAREIGRDATLKAAAMGKSSTCTHRSVRRVSQGGGLSSPSVQGSREYVAHKNKHVSKNQRHRYH